MLTFTVAKTKREKLWTYSQASSLVSRTSKGPLVTEPRLLYHRTPCHPELSFQISHWLCPFLLFSSLILQMSPSSLLMLCFQMSFGCIQNIPNQKGNYSLLDDGKVWIVKKIIIRVPLFFWHILCCMLRLPGLKTYFWHFLHIWRASSSVVGPLISHPKPTECTGKVCICIRWLSICSHRCDTTTQAVNILPKPPSSLSFFSSLDGNHRNTTLPAGLMFPHAQNTLFFFFFPQSAKMWLVIA